MELWTWKSKRGWISLFHILPFLLGLGEAEHRSNGVLERYSTNPTSRKPIEWTDKYTPPDIKTALVRMTIVNKTKEWPGVNDYYKTYINQYANYLVNTSDHTPLTSPPTGLNRYGKEYLGVCINFERLDPAVDSSYLGIFTCPLPFEPAQHTFCCGDKNAEYCCEPEESYTMSLVGGLVILTPILLPLLALSIYTCLCKKKQPPVAPLKESDEEVAGLSSSPQRSETNLGDRYRVDYSLY